MPCQHASSTLGMPAPFDIQPKPRDAFAKLLLNRGVAREILPCAQEALEEERGLDEIAAIVFSTERDRGSGSTVHEMRKVAVKARRPLQQIEHQAQSRGSLRPGDPSPLARNDYCHDAKTGPAYCDGVVLRIRAVPNAIASEPTPRMRPLPKIIECLSLHEIEQL